MGLTSCCSNNDTRADRRGTTTSALDQTAFDDGDHGTGVGGRIKAEVKAKVGTGAKVSFLKVVATISPSSSMKGQCLIPPSSSLMP